MHKQFLFMFSKLLLINNRPRLLGLFWTGLILLTIPIDLAAQRMWINEIYYNDATTKARTDQFVEIVLEANIDLKQAKLVLYDHETGSYYGKTYLLTDFQLGQTSKGFSVYHRNIPELKASQGGLALVYKEIVLHFISYGGAFMARSGLAAGYLSKDASFEPGPQRNISNAREVEQNAGQLSSGMDELSGSLEVSWASMSPSPGKFNNQFIMSPDLSATMVDTPDPGEPVTPGDKIKYTVTITNSGTMDAEGLSIDRLSPDPNTTLVPGSFKSTPIAYDDAVNIVQEDISYTIDLTGFDLDGNNGNNLAFSISSPPLNGTLDPIVQNGQSAAQVEYDPDDDYFGPDQFTFNVTDEDGNTCPAIISIQVQPVNDPPTITCGPNQLVLNSAGAQSIAAWATGISTGPSNESFQDPPIITVANDNNALFSVQPAVATNGTLTYTPAGGASGLANVTVTISDGVPADDVSCSFTITVQAAPDALADDFSTQEDADLTGEDLFADNGNGADDLGSPAGTIVSFGGGDAPGTVTSNTAGATVAFAGGTLQVNANGTFSLTGQPFSQGTFTFEYRLENAAGFDDATVTIVITPAIDPAICNADNYTGTGNIAIAIAAPGVLSNDGGTSPAITAVEGSGANIGIATAATNGTVTLNADGSFTFEPTAGFTGAASFQYTVDNALNQPSTCTVSINFSQMIWFVDNSGTGINAGTFLNPFQSIAAFNASGGPGTGDFVSLAAGTYAEADGFNLQDNQTLIGEGLALNTYFTADANSLPAYSTFAGSSGSAPAIEPSAGNGVDVADGNTLRGFNIDPETAFHGVLGSAANGTIGMTASDITIGGTGIDGIEIPNASGTFSISAVSVIGGESIGIDITTINASVADVTITGCSIDATAVASGRGIDLEAFNTSTMTFDVIANPTLEMNGGTGVVIIARDNANMDGFVRNNTNIDMNGAAGQGVLVDARDDSDIVAEVSGNTITLGGDVGGGVRIAADNPGNVGVGSATMNATVNNNNITIGQNVNFGRGIQLVDHNAHTLCAIVTNNTVTDASTNTDIGISIIDQSATPIQLQGLVGGPFSSGGAVLPGVNTWWTSQGNTDNADAGSTFLQGTVTSGTCSTPTP